MYLRAYGPKNGMSKFFKASLRNELLIRANTGKLFDRLALIGLSCSSCWIVDLHTAASLTRAKYVITA